MLTFYYTMKARRVRIGFGLSGKKKAAGMTPAAPKRSERKRKEGKEKRCGDKLRSA